jgi:hypothetical protein
MAVTEPDREQVARELADAPAAYRALLNAATPQALRRRTNGTRWTNREMLFHLLLGYLLVRNLMPLVWIISRLPRPFQRGFAATLNAFARPFHVMNYVASVIGGRGATLRRLNRMFTNVTATLGRRLARTTQMNLQRTMAFPTRWDPFFTEQMSLLDIYHYPTEHYQFHRAQLTIGVRSAGDDR